MVSKEDKKSVANELETKIIEQIEVFITHSLIF